MRMFMPNKYIAVDLLHKAIEKYEINEKTKNVEKYDDIEGSSEINYWRLHFAKLVLSFRGTTTDPGSGLLNIARSKNQFATVKSAEEVVIPVARMVVGEEFVDDVSDSIATLEQWLSDNRPSDRHLTPDLAPLPENSDQVAIRNKSN